MHIGETLLYKYVYLYLYLERGKSTRNPSNLAARRKGTCQLIWEQREETAVIRTHHQRNTGPQGAREPARSAVPFLAWEGDQDPPEPSSRSRDTLWASTSSLLGLLLPLSPSAFSGSAAEASVPLRRTRREEQADAGICGPPPDEGAANRIRTSSRVSNQCLQTHDSSWIPCGLCLGYRAQQIGSQAWLRPSGEKQSGAFFFPLNSYC